ncbi:MAG: response regulator [Muribaculaceae bacterium]|nr:response regulator [Muribaculaceae bacterium]
MRKTLLTLCMVLGLAIAARAAQFVEVGLSDGLFNDQVQSVCIDGEGLTWVATRYGLSCSDGQKVSTYFPSRGIDAPAFSNNILSVANDGSERIYFVSKSGFAYYDKRTDAFVMPEQSEVQRDMWMVKCLSNGDVLIGHDAGVARYDAATNRVREFSSLGTDINVTGSVKSIIEDRMGQVWIGTWGNNFYRYSPQENKLYHYPSLNPSKSAFTLCQDAQGSIWVGSWDNGLYRLIDPYNLDRLSWQEYNTANSTLHDDRIYAMAVNPATGHLWIGHRKGVSVYKDSDFTSLADEWPELPQLGEVDFIAPGLDAQMWLGTLGKGAVGLDTRPAVFDSAKPAYPGIGEVSAVVTSTFIDRDATIWAGFGAFGIAKIARGGEHWTYPYEQVGFGGTVDVSSVYAICERRNGEMWLATYNGDVMALDRERHLKRVYRSEDSHPRPYGHIMEFYEDSDGNLWLASSRGADALMANGAQKPVGGIDSRVSGIGQTGRHIYFATTEQGLFRCQVPSKGADTILAERVNLPGLDQQPLITDLVVSDSCLLISTETDGIYAYYPATNTLRSTNYITPSIGMRISSMMRTPDGTLWIATNRGLFAKTSEGPLLKFTTDDGLPSDVLMGGMYWRNGQMAIGTSKGVMQFDTSRALSMARAYADPSHAFGLIGLSIGGCDFRAMSTEQRQETTYGVTPYYAERIILPHGYNSVTLTYGSPAWRHNGDSQFACMLQGYDSDWRVGERAVTYSNLPYGTYKFKIKPFGSDVEKTVLLVVKRPWHHSYWAYVLYVLMVLTLLYCSWLFVKHRERELAKIRVLEMEKESMQQVNHTKLVFFTNVTHELLTPLTVISAGIDELKESASGTNPVVSLMDVNVKRLIKLMQQILEFRKAESNNLRLKVSYGDASLFVRREADALSPLINKKHQTLTVNCPDEPLMGYFDSDKLDKILYNLLSNAAKYTGERGLIDITLRRDGDYMVISVSDSGRGIPKDKIKDLFTRFYDGEYREFKTIGTGIGLSLTRDLVELSHGTIEVESEEGVGTTFTVRLPIEASHFNADEMQSQPAEQTVLKPKDADGTDPGDEADDSKQGTVLIVEDNEDLRAMMVRLLEHDYHTVDALDGQAALELMAGRDIDIVITDVMMPRMDGLELTRRLKQDINTSHIPVIVLTAKNQTEDRAEAYECGADAYLSKPFNLTVLLARIRNLLKWRSSRAQDFKNQLVVEIKDMDYDSIDETFITRAIEIVEKHLDDAEFEVPQLAKEIGVGKTTLFNKLKSLTGMNPTSFIRNVRLKASCKIMNENPGIRISDLAYMVGFSDPKYFSICFKREFGMTPTAYVDNATPKEE